jgi:sugar phosphate isomerase/epimerase
MRRREFLKTTAAAGVVLGATPLLNMGFSSAKGRIDKVGLQMYTLGRAAADMEDALAKVKAAGYDQIEFAGYGNKKAQEIRAILDKNGLTSPSIHAQNLFSDDGLKKAIEDARIVGHKFLIVPMLPFNRPAGGPPQGGGQPPAGAPPQGGTQPPAGAPPQGNQPPTGTPRTFTEPTYTLEQAREYVKSFNKIGKTCLDAGLDFAFHSHKVEWKKVTGGDVMMDIFLQETDPKLVTFEIDLGWAIAAGADPIAYFKKYPGRFQLCHVKDITADKKPCVVGEGTIDFRPIFAAARKEGVKYFIVEQDGAPDPFNNVAASAKFIKNLKF